MLFLVVEGLAGLFYRKGTAISVRGKFYGVFCESFPAVAKEGQNITEDIYMLADCLLQQDDIILIEKKDYIKNPKESGYRSLHLIIEIPIFLQNEKRRMKVEVQLRTIAMDFWASVEHKLRYKKNIPDSEAEILALELSDCANQLAQLDDKMEQIKKRIVEAEKESAPKGDRKRPLPTIGGMLIKNRINGVIK